MDSDSVKNIQQWLIEANVDGVHKNITGWHVDEIDLTLSKRRDLWYSKALEFFVQAQVIKEQLGIPWMMFLVIDLKERRKYSDINFYDQKTLEQELHTYTPPEIILFAGDYPTEHLMPLQLNFFPQDLLIYFYKKFNGSSRSYTRKIYIFMKKSHILQLLAAHLYDNYCAFSSDQAQRRIFQHTSNYIYELEHYGQRPFNKQMLTQLGAYYLLVYSNTEKAKCLLYKALDGTSKLNQAYFWLALTLYYSHNSSGAEHILHEAVKHNSRAAACLFLLFYITWERTCSFEYALGYLRKTIELEPHWVLPRLLLARYFMYKRSYDRAAQELICARSSLNSFDLHSFRSLTIAERYLHAYIIGNIPSNKYVIDLHEQVNMHLERYVQCIPVN